jgi:hypothetical protein
MLRLARLQLVGPLVLLGFVLAADLAAYALSLKPSSGLLWYLNLEVFSLFRKSRAALGEYFNLPFAQTMFIAGPMVAVGLAGLMLKRNLGLAISSNLTLVFAAFVAYNWHSWSSISHLQAVSLSSVHVPMGGTFYLFVTLAATSLLSFGASHTLYFRALRADAE